MIFEHWYHLEEPEEPAWRRVLRVVSTPPLSDFMIARLLEMLARWMLRLTNSWVVWDLTHSYEMVGLAVIFLLVPGMVSEPIGGVLADRHDRRLLLGLSNLACGVTALVMGLLAATGTMTVLILFALIVVQGGALAFGQSPAKTLVVALVPKHEIATAVSLNAVVFNVAGFVGPAIAGLLIWGTGAAGAYFAACGMCVVYFALLMRVPPVPAEATHGHSGILTQLQAGFAYVISAPLIGYLFLLHMISAGMARPFMEFVPGTVQQLFEGGPREASLVISAVGVGSILGGLWLAGRGTRVGLMDVALGAMPAFAATVIAFAWCGSYVLGIAIAFLFGIGIMVRATATQSLLQLETNPGYRGRVMALHGVTLDVGALTGALIMGAIAQRFGVQIALTVGALLSVAIWLWLKGRLREAYARHNRSD